MKFLILILPLFILAGCQNSPSSNSNAFNKPSVIQGLTTENFTQISVLRNKGTKYKYKVTPKAPVKISSKTFPSSDWVVDHLYIVGIHLNTNYELSIADPAGRLIDNRYFRALDLQKKQLSVAIASCMDYRKTEHQEQMWDEFNSHESDLFFFIGDNVYGDAESKSKGFATPDELWTKYVKTRNTLKIYFSRQLTPTLATWDDHDFGNNGGGENYPHKKNSLKIFKSFFPQQSVQHKNYDFGPGLSLKVKVGSNSFYFMDNRFFRTNNKTTPQYHWGEHQQKWLIDHLKKDKSLSWIINGNQFFGGYHRFESFEKSHPTNFVKFIKKLKSIRTKVAFISGDRHLTELMKIGSPDLPYETIELTTSAIHAKVFPSHWHKAPNPRQLYGKANALNYALLKLNSTKRGTQINIKAFGLNKVEFYNHSQIIK